VKSSKARIWYGKIPGSHEPGFKEQKIIQRAMPQAARALVHGVADLQLYRFKMGECTILLAHEPGGIHGEMRWHLSISCPDRHPTWDEIKVARYRLLGPDMVAAMILPPTKDYVNMPQQDHVFHLHEIVDTAEVWRSL
jgi:hypothetical protein